MGHIGAHALKQWFDQRNLKVTWHNINQALKMCVNCPNSKLRFNKNYHGKIGYKMGFNTLVQIDFIGPLPRFRNKYACTMVDVTTGLAMTRPGSHPDQQACIMTLLMWCAQYGPPQVIQSDQGSHFTGTLTQRIAKNLGIMWDFHKAYNPTSAGAIEHFNGLLKTQLTHRIGEPLEKALLYSTLELNQRPRLNRDSPLQEALKLQPFLEYTVEGNRDLIRPHLCLHRNQKNNLITKAEIVAQGTGNNMWITQVLIWIALPILDLVWNFCFLIWNHTMVENRTMAHPGTKAMNYTLCWFYFL
uniref:uncharacterized protein LOC123462061 n=1 Tax=Jaculus jaculus TaxID=51337 RepID=UPI001E1B2D35|nr:uncharacterized protein LOC123462061 [Jaculus jaculus]